MQEEFLPILRSLKQNVDEIITPLEAAQLEFYDGDDRKIQSGKDLIMGELAMVVLILTSADTKISPGELTLLNDLRHVVYGYGIPELSSNDYLELRKGFLQQYPKGIFTLDHKPTSLRWLLEYDEKYGTDFATKARTIFTQFADAIVIADKDEQQIETIILENFKDILNTE